jgi:hypothetical protein
MVSLQFIFLILEFAFGENSSLSTKKMGRGKFSMKLISDEKTRMITYHKRKKGLRKKVYELSTLCDVDTCMIMYGPEQKNHPRDFATWPESREKLRRIINRFKVKGAHPKGSRGISGYFIDRKNNIDKEISRNRLKSYEAIYRPWDERFDDFSDAQMRTALMLLDAKLDAAQRKLDDCMMITKDASSGIMGTADQAMMFQKNMNVEAINYPQPISCVKPLHYSLLPPDFNPIKMNDDQDYCANFGGMHSSDMAQSTPLNGPVYYDPTLNNPMVVPPMYDYDSTMQMMMPNLQYHYPMMQTVSNYPMYGIEFKMNNMIQR